MQEIAVLCSVGRQTDAAPARRYCRSVGTAERRRGRRLVDAVDSAVRSHLHLELPRRQARVR